MASGHFLCLLLFVAWSVSSFNLAFGDSSLLPESESNHEVEEEKTFLPFKKFPKFKAPFGKPFFKPLPFKQHHTPKFNFNPPHHETTSPEEGSLYNNEVSDAAQDVNDDKHLPKFKFLPKFPFHPKFPFPKKKFPHKFPHKFPFPKPHFPVPKDINKPYGEQASEEVTKPMESTPSTILPKNSGSKAAELESSASSTTTKP